MKNKVLISCLGLFLMASLNALGSHAGQTGKTLNASEEVRYKKQLIHTLQKEAKRYESLSLPEIQKDLTGKIEVSLKEMSEYLNPSAYREVSALYSDILNSIKTMDSKEIFLSRYYQQIQSLSVSDGYIYILTKKVAYKFEFADRIREYIFYPMLFLPAVALDTLMIPLELSLDAYNEAHRH
jgi:hypothetical protein